MVAGPRSLAMRRLVAGAIRCSASPPSSSPTRHPRSPHLVGVGRGTDLVLYALCVAFLFMTIALYLRLNEMHDRYVELARRLALHEALHDTPHEPVPVAGRHSSDPY